MHPLRGSFSVLVLYDVAEQIDLVRISSRFIAEPKIEKYTLELVRARLTHVRAALVESYSSWLSEDYYIINLREALDEHGNQQSAASLLGTHGDEIARIVRGES